MGTSSSTISIFHVWFSSSLKVDGTITCENKCHFRSDIDRTFNLQSRSFTIDQLQPAFHILKSDSMMRIHIPLSGEIPSVSVLLSSLSVIIDDNIKIFFLFIRCDCDNCIVFFLGKTMK